MIYSRRKIFLGLSGGLTMCTRTEYIDRSDSERCHFNELRPDEHSILTCQLLISGEPSELGMHEPTPLLDSNTQIMPV